MKMGRFDAKIRENSLLFTAFGLKMHFFDKKRTVI